MILPFAPRVPVEPDPTDEQKAAAQALASAIDRALAVARWLASPAPAGWEDGANER